MIEQSQMAAVSLWSSSQTRCARGRVRDGLLWIFASLLLVTNQASGKDAFQYDPSTCKTDAKGHLYIALGPNVFSVPYSKSGVYLLDSVSPKEKRPAPDPSEQVGCLGNPIQQRSFAFLAGTPLADVERGSSSSEHIEAATKLTLFATRADYRWLGEPSPDFPESMCAGDAIRETMTSGLTACRIPLWRKPNAAVQDLGGVFFSNTGIYTTPLGRRFVVHCAPYLYSAPGNASCRVAYAITNDLAVVYEFQPYRGPSPIPIEHIINFDRKLRAQIDAAIVKDFAWPSQEKRIDEGKP